MADGTNEPTWVAPTHRALIDAGITVVGYVPDAGLSHLIVRLDADPAVTTVRLTTEEEGVALMTGTWLGGGRGGLLMQSSGVGNCINMLAVLAACRVPGVMVVTMRGQEGEGNPWQVPMGSVTGQSMALLGVDVRSVGSADRVAVEVDRACVDGFRSGEERAVAVLVEQRVIGVKSFDSESDSGAATLSTERTGS